MAGARAKSPALEVRAERTKRPGLAARTQKKRPRERPAGAKRPPPPSVCRGFRPAADCSRPPPVPSRPVSPRFRLQTYVDDGIVDGPLQHGRVVEVLGGDVVAPIGRRRCRHCRRGGGCRERPRLRGSVRGGAARRGAREPTVVTARVWAGRRRQRRRKTRPAQRRLTGAVEGRREAREGKGGGGGGGRERWAARETRTRPVWLAAAGSCVGTIVRFWDRKRAMQWQQRRSGARSGALRARAEAEQRPATGGRGRCARAGWSRPVPSRGRGDGKGEVALDRAADRGGDGSKPPRRGGASGPSPSRAGTLAPRIGRRRACARRDRRPDGLHF